MSCGRVRGARPGICNVIARPQPGSLPPLPGGRKMGLAAVKVTRNPWLGSAAPRLPVRKRISLFGPATAQRGGAVAVARHWPRATRNIVPTCAASSSQVQAILRPGRLRLLTTISTTPTGHEGAISNGAKPATQARRRHVGACCPTAPACRVTPAPALFERGWAALSS